MASASLPEAQPSGWGKNKNQKFAAQIASPWGYKPGDDLEKLMRSLGGRIEVGTIDEVLTTGSITVNGPGDFVISLSPISGSRRSRFTIAHELGHYVLHSRLGKEPVSVPAMGPGKWSGKPTGLLPAFSCRREFREQRKAGWGDAELATHFDVSEAAVQVRRQSLGT